MAFIAPERYRWERPGNGYNSTAADGNNGVFVVPQRDGPTLRVICSDGGGWDHVSVSLPDRCPTWDEMCYVKALFWSASDCVVQYHPPKIDYVNRHQHCLHLWRPQDDTIPMPPVIMVG